MPMMIDDDDNDDQHHYIFLYILVQYDYRIFVIQSPIPIYLFIVFSLIKRSNDESPQNKYPEKHNFE